MTDYTGFKVGISLGGILGAFAAGVLITNVPAPAETKTSIIKVPVVETREVPGPTKYRTMPFPQSCVDAGHKVEQAFRASMRMQDLAEEISYRAKNELVPNSIMGDNEAVATDNAYILRRSDSIIRRMYLWEETGQMAEWYVRKCEKEIEESKSGTQPGTSSGDGDPFN